MPRITPCRVAARLTGEHRIVHEGGAFGRYASTGHLLFWRDNDLWAVGFDLELLETVGEPVRIVEHVRFDPRNGLGRFAVSETGTLAYVAGTLDYRQETILVDRSGNTIIPAEEFGPSGDLSFSPDGGRLAMTLLEGSAFQIGVYDIERRFMNRLTSSLDNLRPTWTPDGNTVTYVSNREGSYRFYSQLANGSSNAEEVPGIGSVGCCPMAQWNADGNEVLFDIEGDEGRSVWVASPDGSGDRQNVFSESGSQSFARWSPDGRHIVYESRQSGATEWQVYVRPYPGSEGGREQVSLAGGRRPVWSGDGSIIYFVTNEGIMAVDFDSGSNSSDISIGEAELVLEMTGVLEFDVSPDDTMFAIDRAPIEDFPTEIRVVTNWFEELLEEVPVN